ncbi:MAG: hypothetical protein IKZ92_10025 [Muribaculaceae bacterium]|nr:hypothetical protein [Muribaculaceae bacterium]
MNKLVLRNLTLILLCLVSANVFAQDIWDGTTASGFYGGSGTESDPYQIRTGAELVYFANLVNSGDDFSGKYVKLMNDIDMNKQSFSVTELFAGTFDGNGKFITMMLGLPTNNNPFMRVSGRIHHLGVKIDFENEYKGLYYGKIPLVYRLVEGSILEDCYYSIQTTNELFFYQPTLAWENDGVIKNCCAEGHFNVYGGYSSSSDGSLLVYNNNSTGVIENCYANVNGCKTGYGKALPISFTNNGTIIHNSNDIDSLNMWVDEHPDHSRWTNSGQYKLVDFNPSSECTIEFLDSLFNNSIPAIKRPYGEPVGELPVPTSSWSFIGWKRAGKIVTPDIIVDGNWTLFAVWQQLIRRQPTFENMSIEVDDFENASFHWYGVFGEPTLFEYWISPQIDNSEITSYAIEFDATEGQVFSFNYKVSSERGYDVLNVWRNGVSILVASGEETGHFIDELPADGNYRYTFMYSKDDDSSEGSDNVIISNISLSFPANQLDCTSSQLPDYLITQNGLYYCKVNYSNTGVVLTSDTVIVNERYLDNILEINNLVAHTGTIQTMPVNLVNHDNIVGVEFDLLLPEGVTLEDKCLGERSETHQRTTELMDNGAWHFSIQSSAATNIDGNEGNILYLILKIGEDVAYSDYMITLSNVKLMTQSETLIHPKDVVSRLSILPNGDINQDGRINISDVTSLIDFLLRH